MRGPCCAAQVSAASASGRPADLDTISEELFRQLSAGQTVNLSSILGAASEGRAAQAPAASRALPAAHEQGHPARLHPAEPARLPPPAAAAAAARQAACKEAPSSSAEVAAGRPGPSSSDAAAAVAVVGLQVRAPCALLGTCMHAEPSAGLTKNR